MDNLSVHHHPTVVLAILNAGHRIAFRAPYHPVDGPIEYTFNTIECGLKIRMNEIFHIDDVTVVVQELIQNIQSFDSYFYHCGYR